MTLFLYGCAQQHSSGVPAADGTVGPPLTNVATRSYLAGVFPTPENLIHWIRHPQQIDAGTAMPDLGVSVEQARHIAAYLYTLR